MPLRLRLCVSEIRPPRSTDWPLAAVIVLLIFRCDNAGVNVVALAFAATSLTSWLISSRTLPLTLTLGLTERMTPVLR
jgi:hypothetical protein